MKAKASDDHTKLLEWVSVLVTQLSNMGYRNPHLEVNGGDLVELMGEWYPLLKRELKRQRAKYRIFEENLR